MKKKIFAIAIVVILALSLSIIPFTMAGATDVYSTLNLVSKDSTTWLDTSGTTGMSGVLQYKPSGTSFEFILTAQGLAIDTEYSLIYYTDVPNRFDSGNWGGANGIVIAEFRTDGAGVIDSDTMSSYLGMSMPNGIDANANPVIYNYTTSDGYVHANGAKIWLVKSSALTDGNKMPVVVWSPNEWLFETDLIGYQQVVSQPIGMIGTAEVPLLTLAKSVIPEPLYVTAIYPVTITVTNSMPVAFNHVYGKITGWNPENFRIVYPAAVAAGVDGNLNTSRFCGFWAGDVYYFGPSANKGDSYVDAIPRSFVFEITPLKAGDFNIGIVLVAGIADPRP